MLLCSRSLRAENGHVYYFGTAGAAAVGFIDASEMRPTFGAAADETRGFALHGWADVGNDEGDMSEKGPLYLIDFRSFRKDVAANLTSKDTRCSPFSE